MEDKNSKEKESEKNGTDPDSINDLPHIKLNDEDINHSHIAHNSSRLITPNESLYKIKKCMLLMYIHTLTLDIKDPSFTTNTLLCKAYISILLHLSNNGLIILIIILYSFIPLNAYFNLQSL